MKTIFNNPSFTKLRRLTRQMPKFSYTEWGSFNIVTKVKARSPQSTFLVGGSNSAMPSISRKEYEEFAKKQDRYLEERGTIRIDGSIGTSSRAKANASLFIEKSFPNIAAMQKQLFFKPQANFKQDLNIIYTPGLPANEWPDNICILVDLNNYTTRIAGTDYFGESKKAGLRMWNKWIYDRSGLALHAGCKTYRDPQGCENSILIIGLSGTGKTTTTFTPHLNSQPIQDDFCALFPNGKVYSSENGCFAKTYGLNSKDEPLIYKGLSNGKAWLENTYVNQIGQVDFNNDQYTTNGRGTFSLDSIPHGDIHNIPRLKIIFILNHNRNILPAIVKLDHLQAAAYFMLGETTGTSAGGKTEAGKSLRIPGTNPFFPMDKALQGNRFFELLESAPEVDVYLLNTGYIGWKPEHLQKVTIEHSRKLINALLKDELKWNTDADFKYKDVTKASSPIDTCFIQPREYYLNAGREQDYQDRVLSLKQARNKFLSKFAVLKDQISSAI